MQAEILQYLAGAKGSCFELSTGLQCGKSCFNKQIKYNFSCLHGEVSHSWASHIMPF